jgi:2-polyprenyl-3-methyl-5-hydroxy-6-metoxy-1,4-benzoquinol methylase
LGCVPDDIVWMIREHAAVGEEAKVLDLACGKGAVSVHIAKSLGFSVKGIDIVPEFIEIAKDKAKEYGVTQLCTFCAEDIHKSVAREKDWDIVIYGAVGDVLGEAAQILEKLKQVLRPGGYLVIDDAYHLGAPGGQYLTKEQWAIRIEAAGYRFIAEKITDAEEIAALNRVQQAQIARRAQELILSHPQQKQLFLDYLESQREECEALENTLAGVVFILKKI